MLNGGPKGKKKFSNQRKTEKKNRKKFLVKIENTIYFHVSDFYPFLSLHLCTPFLFNSPIIYLIVEFIIRCWIADNHFGKCVSTMNWEEEPAHFISGIRPGAVECNAVQSDVHNAHTRCKYLIKISRQRIGSDLFGICQLAIVWLSGECARALTFDLFRFRIYLIGLLTMCV